MNFSLRTEVVDGIVKESMLVTQIPKRSQTPDEMLDHFGGKCAVLMSDMMEAVINSFIPDGVHYDNWLRAHSLHIDVSMIKDGIKHTLLRDGETVAEIKYRDGKVSSRVFMGRGIQ